MKRLILLFICISLMTLQVVHAQVRQVSGTVTGSADNLPIPGATVVVKGTSIGTITGIDGKYRLELPQNAKTLVFSFVGMKSVELPVSGTVISVALDPDVIGIEEVIAVAYGTAKKSSLTGAATQIGSEKIAARPVTNISKAIEGATSGVQVSSGSGQPGAGQSIRIRGFGSVNASNDPLYILDGVPYAGNISNINPDDIESVSILKDAASTALYGNKAANGVVLVTTKKGSMARNTFNIKLSQGFSERAIPEYERVDAYDYYPLMWEAYRNQIYYVTTNKPTLDVANQRASGLVTGVNGIKYMLGYNIFNVADNEIVGADGKLNPNAKIRPGYSGDLDWYKPIRRTGKRSDFNTSYSGGTDKSDYFASLGYTKEEGYVIGSDFKRVTARINANVQPKKWIKTGLNISGTTSETNETNTGSSTGYVNPFFFARNIGPIYPVYAHDPTTGDFLLDSNGEKIYDLGNLSQYGLPARPAGASVGRHVVAETLLNSRTAERNELNGKTYLDIMFLNGFKFTANFSTTIYNYRYNTYENKIVGDGSPAGRAGKESDITTTQTFNQLLTYTRSFGKHSFDALIGHESYKYQYKYFYGFRQGQVADGNYELINFTTTNSLSSYISDYRSEGYLSRINYNYDNKYFISGSFRRDGSSKFFSDVRWGNFWSIGGAWRMDHEEFMQGLTFIDLLKIRSSYGQVGNDSGIGNYAWQALYGLDYNNSSEPGILQSSLKSENLVWEQNANFDVAVEFELIKRIRGTIEYFHRQSSNLLFSVPKPLSSGITSRDENVGTLYNKGIEADLSLDVIKGDKFNWTFGINATTFRNEFTKLPQKEIIDGTKKLMVGHSLYDYWLREWMGVNPDDGRAMYRADRTSYATDKAAFDANPASTGILDYKIVEQDTMTFNSNKAMYHYASSAIPKVFGSVNNNFRYGNFDLQIMLTYQVGGKVYDATYASLMDPGNYGSSLHVDMLKRWQKEGDIAEVPRMDGNSTNRTYFSAASDRWLTDASYLNVRSVTLSYNIPSSIMKKIDLSNCRIYASGENLYLFSARKGMAVQQSFTGVTSNDYIPSRIITFGINITF
jgi:TonB-linked SusC/RagA family outer membrane protein